MTTRPLDLRSLDRSRPLIGASILSADFARLGEEAASALQAGADMLHVDVMDGHFVPNITMGPVVCAALRRALPGAIQDVHLMIQHPERYLEAFVRAGADHLTLHAEVIDPSRADRVAGAIRSLGATAGICVKPGTPLEPWLDLFGLFDMVLVMSVEPGFSGQSFIESTPERVSTIRGRVPSRVILAVDGGLTPATAPLVTAAGADLVIAATAIYGERADKRRHAIDGLRSCRAPSHR